MQIYHSSALDFMSTLKPQSVGAIITDPPFHVSVGRELIFGGDRRAHAPRGFGRDPWTEVSDLDGVIEWTKPHAREAARVVRPGGALVVMGSTQSLAGWDVCCSKYGFQWMAELIVLWNTGKPRANNFGSLHTRVVWYSRVGYRHSFNSEAKSIYSNVVVCKKIPSVLRRHPSEKPVGLTNFIISVLTRADDLVYDPFAGSGSTMVSAEQAGRPWVGTELDPTHAATAQLRMEDADDEDADPVHLWINGKLREV